MDELLIQIRQCKVCEPYLQLGPRPIIAASPNSKLIIIGQAPGKIVHETGIPWNDKSGDNLRTWMGINKETFYDPEKIALIPMGFCFPGSDKKGHFPPRPECAPLWHDKLFGYIRGPRLILLVGEYAQQYYLKNNAKQNLTETVKHFKSYLPKYFPLPHPSPRNNIWLSKNEWFAKDVLPVLQKKIKKVLCDTL